MSNQHFFRVPWATSGDRDDIPDATQADGSVNYTQGFGFDYERDPATDPEAKNIQRESFNGLAYDITENIRQYQLFGVPEWVAPAQNGGTAVSYTRYARVRYDTAGDGSNWLVYESSVDANTSVPGADTNWTVVSNSTYYAQDTGTANTYRGAYVPAVTSLRDGLTLGFTAANANSGASTFAPNGIAAKPLIGQAQQPLQGGEILANSRTQVRYSSTLDSWILVFASGGALQTATGVRSGHAANIAQIQSGALIYAADSGSGNAYVANLTPAAGALFDGMLLVFRTNRANTINTPSLKLNGTPAKTIRKPADKALFVGDIPDGPFECLLQFNAASDRWVLLNPALGILTATDGTDFAYVDDSARPASTSWVRRAMNSIAVNSGFSSSFGTSGYVKLPSWLGGFIMQWGYLTTTGGATATASFPIAFPNACYQAVSSHDGPDVTAASGIITAISFTNTQVTVGGRSIAGGTGGVIGVRYLAVGR